MTEGILNMCQKIQHSTPAEIYAELTRWQEEQRAKKTKASAELIDEIKDAVLQEFNEYDLEYGFDACPKFIEDFSDPEEGGDLRGLVLHNEKVQNALIKFVMEIL